MLRTLVGSNETDVARRLGISAETVAHIVHLQLADAKDKEIDPERVITHVGMDELSLKKRHKLYVTILTDLTNPERPEVLALAPGRDEAAGRWTGATWEVPGARPTRRPPARLRREYTARCTGPKRY